jgi:hypothetical protein
MELLENHWKAPVTIQNRTVDTAEETPSTAYRKMKKDSQRRFWARFGVTQSRGSRFESGAEIPPPVSILLGLYFLKTVSDGDLGRAERVIYSRDAAALLNPGQ